VIIRASCSQKLRQLPGVVRVFRSDNDDAENDHKDTNTQQTSSYNVHRLGKRLGKTGLGEALVSHERPQKLSIRPE